MEKLLLGNESIAQAAIDSGISGVYAYPGTPSTETTEYIQKSKQAIDNHIHRTWSANEKTAMEAALGMSYTGKRALVCMKHVGLNVAADPFMNMAITGINGGLVIFVADDPSMHSSQDEQDSRFYAKFAFIPIFEPSNQQEAYDLTRFAFDFSETHKLPVMMRMTTRLAHSRAGIKLSTARPQNPIRLHENPKQFILLPVNARKQYLDLLAKQDSIIKASENLQYNIYQYGTNKTMGIIASGIAYNYVKENYIDENCPYPILKIVQYPLPIALIEKMADECDTILVVEEGYPFIEEGLRGLLNRNLIIKGRLDGTLPRTGELTPNILTEALGLHLPKGLESSPIVTNRPPSLCNGCPHIDSYLALNEAMKEYGSGKVFSDIGCYTLGALPPYNAIYTTVDMGASITMAKGATDAGLTPAIAVIGDSTFTHSGMTSLLDAIIDKTSITVLILDNSTTGMTGGQPSHAIGRLTSICEGLGVEKEHIRIIKPLKNQQEINVKIIQEEIKYQGVSVIIPTRECIQTLNRRLKTQSKSRS